MNCIIDHNTIHAVNNKIPLNDSLLRLGSGKQGLGC